jgi:hypothetical protein
MRISHFFFAAAVLLGSACGRAETSQLAIVTRDEAPLRGAPRASGAVQAVIWQGEVLEVRGERLDYLQVYDHSRERAGFVRADEVRRIALTPQEAPELLAIVRFLRLNPGRESLGIGFAAAYLRAASAEALQGEAGIEVLDALGTFADRLAQRASAASGLSKAAQAALSAHLEVAARYGVRFTSSERGGRMQLCYDGEAFGRVLAMPSTAEQRARAALALTRAQCVPDELRPLERRRMDEWRAEVLDRVDAAALAGYLKNRIHMRRAAVWSALAYELARQGDAADAAASRSLAELASVDKSELAHEDARAYAEAAMRVNASRWASVAEPLAAPGRGPQIVAVPGAPGETCLLLIDPKHGPASPLARRCTYGIAWTASATTNREGTALALAVQPGEAWRELWIFRKSRTGWSVRALPPAAAAPGVGYAEFAGWVPGGSQILVAREALAEGKLRRSFELMRLDTLAAVRQAGEPEALGAFRRWQDPSWKQNTLSMR